jgi:hypothetical protein
VSQEEYVAVLSRIAQAAETIATVIRQTATPKETAQSPPEGITLFEQAMILILRHRITSRAEIARRLGVHRSTIVRMKHLNSAIFYVEVMSGAHRHDPNPAPDDE